MGQESAAVKAELRQHNQCHQHMGCVISALHSLDYQLKDEQELMDRKSRKMTTIYNSLHLRADVDRLYIPKKYGRRGLISTQESTGCGKIK